ncbi:hypothetical protein LCGC14_1495400 [marine sediment metagenome]|uniref:Uncharacterized protein n=1 Tax=marine sediment metagenome TaxID=412755 RepID=A0A0F9LL29_9ZZZZ
MFCPNCGSKLQEVKIDMPDDIDWCDPKQVDEYMALEEKKNGSVDMVCTNKNYQCFGKGFPLVFHHPLKGMKSAPGDSWSLTWLK